MVSGAHVQDYLDPGRTTEASRAEGAGVAEPESSDPGTRAVCAPAPAADPGKSQAPASLSSSVKRAVAVQGGWEDGVALTCPKHP